MKALVVAGGIPQIELIRQLKERGIETVLVDGNAAAVARPFADKFYRVDIFDIPAVKIIAEKEQVVLVVAQASEELGLPCYIDYETAQAVSDKIKMKTLFKQIGVPTTDYITTDYLDEEAVSRLRFPLVVKPIDAYSSKGVRKAANINELRRFYTEAREISRSGGVIIEEYFQGEEISVDAFVTGGKAKILTVTNSEKVRNKDRFVIFRGRYPAAVSDTVLQKIEDIAQKIAEGFGLWESPLLIQLLHDGDKVSVLEFCARTGGGMKWLMIKHACGVDVIKATIDITLGLTPDLKRRDTGNKIVVNDFIYCRPGIFDHLEGFEEMHEQGLINEYRLIRTKGTVMRGVTSSSDRIAGMNIVADSIEEFNEKEKKILETIKVVDADGKNIMRKDLLPPLR